VEVEKPDARRRREEALKRALGIEKRGKYKSRRLYACGFFILLFLSRFENRSCHFVVGRVVADQNPLVPVFSMEIPAQQIVVMVNLVPIPVFQMVQDIPLPKDTLSLAVYRFQIRQTIQDDSPFIFVLLLIECCHFGYLLPEIFGLPPPSVYRSWRIL
jgi:hypothetical protein